MGSQWVAKRGGFRDILHEVFLVGLVHDIGRLLLPTVVEEIKDAGKRITPDTAADAKL